MQRELEAAMAGIKIIIETIPLGKKEPAWFAARARQQTLIHMGLGPQAELIRDTTPPVRQS